MIILGVSRLQSSLIDWHVSLALRAMFEAISLTWVPCLEHVLVGMWPNCLKYSIIKTSNDHGRPSLPPLSSLGGLILTPTLPYIIGNVFLLYSSKNTWTYCWNFRGAPPWLHDKTMSWDFHGNTRSMGTP